MRKDAGQRGLDLVEVQVELIRADTDHPGVEDEVRIALLGERLDERRLGGDVGGVELDLLEAGRADLPFLDGDRASTVDLLELDEEDLAGAVLVSATGSGAPA